MSPSQPGDDLDQPEANNGPVNPPLTIGGGKGLSLNTNHSFFTERGITDDQIKTFCLGYANRGIMKERICFPIHNPQGELIAYAGRWPSGEVPEGELRYKLPKNFQKSYVLYNLNRVKETFPETNTLVLVEGYWSVIRLHTANIPVCALMGTSVSNQHIELMEQHGIKQIILIMDGDDAGRKAAVSNTALLCPNFFTRTVVLDEGVKPDSMNLQLVNDIDF